jgi:site-specific recombinase XerD
MADLILTVSSNSSRELSGIRYLKELSTKAVGSAHSRRAYELAIEEFIAWSLEDGKIRLTAKTLQEYQGYLMQRTNPSGQPLAPSTVNVKMAAVRALVHSAATAEWITEQDEEQILKRLKSRPVQGRRQGHRMPLEDVKRCLQLPDRSKIQGKRDYAMLGLLFSCGLRRAELCSLEVKTIGKLGGGWALVDLLGKRRKVRSIPLEDPIKQGIDEWLAAAQITKGRIFRAIRKNGKPWGTGLDEEAVLRMVRRYAALVGHENFAPHDARRSCARIYYDAKAPLEQIKYMLGHDKLDTTAKYVNDEQKFGEGAVTKVVDIS